MIKSKTASLFFRKKEIRIMKNYAELQRKRSRNRSSEEVLQQRLVTLSSHLNKVSSENQVRDIRVELKRKSVMRQSKGHQEQTSGFKRLARQKEELQIKLSQAEARISECDHVSKLLEGKRNSLQNQLVQNKIRNQSLRTQIHNLKTKLDEVCQKVFRQSRLIRQNRPLLGSLAKKGILEIQQLAVMSEQLLCHSSSQVDSKLIKKQCIREAELIEVKAASERINAGRVRLMKVLYAQKFLEAVIKAKIRRQVDDNSKLQMCFSRIKQATNNSDPCSVVNKFFGFDNAFKVLIQTISNIQGRTEVARQRKQQCKQTLARTQKLAGDSLHKQQRSSTLVDFGWATKIQKSWNLEAQSSITLERIDRWVNYNLQKLYQLNSAEKLLLNTQHRIKKLLQVIRCQLLKQQPPLSQLAVQWSPL